MLKTTQKEMKDLLQQKSNKNLRKNLTFCITESYAEEAISPNSRAKHFDNIFSDSDKNSIKSCPTK